MSCCNKKKNRWKTAVWLAVVLGVASLAILSDVFGEPAPTNSAQLAVNVTCPVTTDEKIDPTISTTYNGREVYFCCKRCKRKFESEPQAYVSNLPQGYFASATSKAAASEASIHEHSAHEHAEPVAAQAPRPLDEAGHTESAMGQEDHGGHAHGNTAAAHGHGDDGHASDSADAHGSTANASESDGHDHSAHAPSETQGPLARLLGWVGKFHPPTTDFPIALMIAALLAECLYVATDRPMFDAAGRFTVWFAIAGTIAAVILGWFFAGFKLTDGEWLVTTHRWVGTAVGVWALVLAWFAIKAWPRSEGEAAHRRCGYRVALVIAVVLVSVNGFLGGAMIYGIDHYFW